MKLRVLIWQLGLTGDYCPYCGKTLLPHFGEWADRWTCQKKGCSFNE